ncbi:LysR family transcriptional regulator [Curvibacter sp. RS43]|uniref:LysR family transcriptional regulator n=1 Tax=Curvibacter microcysteis TaxID=3026419 RepID=A0ABT5MDW6_9BURK|nr:MULTISPECIES: LysR family transcriptional regulator [unclassified Curvibacter]MDD0809602.1 LysR family transcriptional regulator [Curvibacter sp. RS43]MDD0814778.1 LysR family transcriptional regulator [Curvibacter sp. HBC28]
MRINLDFGELQAFVAVADKSSFKAAAESLFISQPALSRRIEKLEAELKTQLFQRTTRRVALTDEGRQLLVHATAVMEELKLAYLGLEAKAVARTGKVTLACVPSVAHHVLPAVLKDFALTHSAVRVKVIDESAQTVLDSVLHGHADFGLNFLGSQEADLEFLPVRVEHYVAVVPEAHALARRQSVSWRSLLKEPLIAVSSASGNRLLIDNAIARTGIRPHLQYEINHVTGALSLVAAGLGVAVLPALALQGPLQTGLRGVNLVEPGISRTLGLIVRKGAHLHAEAQALADRLVSALRLD